MHWIWSSEVKCIVTVWFLWSFWYILSNGVGDVTSRWRHFWFTSQHQSDLKYITHNSGSHYCFYYHSHQHTRTRNKNIYIAIKDYPQIRVVHSFWERPIYLTLSFCQTLQHSKIFPHIFCMSQHPFHVLKANDLDVQHDYPDVVQMRKKIFPLLLV